jgi:arginine exporter protein ArgO
MNTGLLIGFTLCFAFGFLLSILLVYNDDPRRLERWFWERTIVVFCDICIAVLCVAGIVAFGFALTATAEFNWLGPVILGTLQLFASTSVSKMAVVPA